MPNNPESTYRQLRFGTPIPTYEYFLSLPTHVILRIYFALGFSLNSMSPISSIIGQMKMNPYTTTREINEVFDAIIMEDNDK